MIETRFNPNANLILVNVTIWGPIGQLNVLLALDTGATDTLIVPDILDRLGYSARDGIKITVTTGVVEEQTGYEIPVRRFATLGYEVTDFVVSAHDLHENAGIDGLLGLNFLRRFNYEVRSREGLIRLDPV